MNAVSETKSIVNNTLYNSKNIRKVSPITYMADMDVIGDYKPTAPKLAPLKYDEFVYSKPVQQPQQAHVSFMHRVARFFGLN